MNITEKEHAATSTARKKTVRRTRKSASYICEKPVNKGTEVSPLSQQYVLAESCADLMADWVAIYSKASGIISQGRTTKSIYSAYKSITQAAFCASELERVTMIRKGVPASILVEMGRTMDISNDLLWTTLALPRSTVTRKIQKKEFLSAEQSERVLGLERLVGQVEEMVRQSGNTEGFDAGRWVGEWLQRSLPALGGKKPAEFMDTMAGQDLISKLLAQSQSGAYA